MTLFAIAAFFTGFTFGLALSLGRLAHMQRIMNEQNALMKSILDERDNIVGACQDAARINMRHRAREN